MDGRLVPEHLPVRDTVLAVEEAVVGGEEDERVVELAGLTQCLDDRRDRFVHGHQCLAALLPVLLDRRDPACVEQRPLPDHPRLVGNVRLVEARRFRQGRAFQCVVVARRRNRSAELRRIVGLTGRAGVVAEERNPEEERPLRRAAPDDLVRLVPVDVGLVARRLRGRAERVQRSAFVERVVVVAVGRGIDGAVPLAPAGWDLRRVLAAVAVEELAEVHGVVAAALQPDGQRVGLVERLVAALRRRIPANAVVVRVLPGQKRRA